MECDPQPTGLPQTRGDPVRVLVAASGYIDLTSSDESYNSVCAAAGRAARASGCQDTNPDNAQYESIRCSDTFVQMNTTYTDSQRFMFHKVYGSTQPNEGMFAEILPLILDSANGINGHVVVRRLYWHNCESCLIV